MKFPDDTSTKSVLHRIKKDQENQKDTTISVNNKSEGLSGKRVELCEKEIDLNKIREIVERTPDIREEKVKLSSEKISSGNYHVSSKEIADRMLKEHLIESSLTTQT